MSDPSSSTAVPTAGAKPTGSVIVVSYNTRELTLRCLETLARETRRIPIEIIVVDNASSDGSAEAIRSACPQVHLLALKDNIGFGAANNLAAESARGEYLVLLNPDTEVLDGAIDRILEYALRTRAEGILGGRTLFADGSLNPSSCWGAPTLWSGFCQAVGLTTLFPRSALFDPRSLGRWPRDAEREVDIVSGCFLVLPRKLWQQLEGFDPRFFMYGEDVDLNLRASRIAPRARIVPEATIIHHGAASEPRKGDKLVRLCRAQCQLMRLHWSPLRSAIGVRLLLFGAGLRALGSRTMRAAKRQRGSADERPWEKVWSSRRDWSEPRADRSTQ